MNYPCNKPESEASNLVNTASRVFRKGLLDGQVGLLLLLKILISFFMPPTFRSSFIKKIGALSSLLCLLSITGLALPAAAQPPTSDYSAKVRLAQAYEQTHDVVNAVRLYEELYAINPTDEVVFEGLTRDLLFLKRFDRAETILKPRMTNGASLETQLLYARVEANLNKRSDALDVFKQAEESVHAKDCMQLFPIVYAMMDVSYNQDATALLDRMKTLGGDDPDLCSSQIAGVYLRLGDYSRASKEMLSLIAINEGNVGMVEQRLAQYMTDSLSRTTVLGALESEILASDQTAGNLRLLAWLYGEEKDYAKALAAIVKLDDLADPEKRGNQGFELLQFADRARNEGALSVAVTAYDEAIKRLKSSTNVHQNYFIAQAELGALKTTERFDLSRVHTSDDISKLVTRYESYAAEQQTMELALDALLHAGELSFQELFDLQRATKDYESALSHSHGMSQQAREAAFGLVDIAYAGGNFPLAESRLQSIEAILSTSKSASEQDIRNHILYDRALGQYYQGNFDSSLSMLNQVAADASSDYANDAIQLSSLIEENNTPTGKTALGIYSKAALAEAGRKYEEARGGYQSIVESQSYAPLADDAALRAAEMLVKLHKPKEAVDELETMQEKMLSSPLLDMAAIREAEIVEQELHDKARAQHLYEDFLAKFPNSSYTTEARDNARRLRGDLF